MDTNVEDHQSESSGEESKEIKTLPAKAQHPHTPLGPTSGDHKSEF